jgi:hypothetical protein
VDHQHEGQRGDHADRVEILHRIERRLRRCVRADGERHVAHQQRIAVGRTLRQRIGRDVARGAGAVLDHDRLAEPVLQLRAQHARDDVGRPAGGKAHQHANRFGRKGLRRRSEGNEHQ